MEANHLHSEFYEIDADNARKMSRSRAAGAMLTNFHLPRSSLLLLVCALAGKDLVLAAYRHALKSNYRFYSYGDCMLIL